MKAETIHLSKDMDRDGVIRALIPIVKRHVSRLSRGPHAKVGDDDLLSAGMRGLFEASKQFDPSRVDSFVGYASLRIRGAMIDELRKCDSLSQDLRSRSRQLDVTICRLEQRLGRTPEELEVAAELGLDESAYAELLESLAAVKMMSLDDVGDHTMELRLHEDDPARQVERQEIRQQLMDCVALLPLREQQVMAMHYDHDLSFREIGEVMNLTAARVCQLHALAIHRVKAHLGVPSEETSDVSEPRLIKDKMGPRTGAQLKPTGKRKEVSRV